MMRHFVTTAILSALLLSCGGSAGNVPIPRRTAYPRVLVYDSVYTAVDSLPLAISANVSAEKCIERRQDGTYWVNIYYPDYHSTIYLTLTPVTEADIDDVIDNRTERIHRNIGYVEPQIIDITSDADYISNLVVTPSVVTTPLQLISVRGSDPRWVVSGAAFFDNVKPDSPVDSLRPMIDIMQRDIVYMLKNIADR